MGSHRRDRRNRHPRQEIELTTVLVIARRMALSHGANQHEADDVAQITAIKLWQRWDQPNTVAARSAGPRPWSSYVWMAAQRTFYDLIRSHQRRVDRNHRAFLAHHGPAALTSPLVAPDSPGGIEDLIARDALAHRIAELPPMRRRIAALVFLDGLSPNEAAARSGVQPQTVHKHLRAAQEQLRAVFADPDQDRQGPPSPDPLPKERETGSTR